MTAYRQVDGLVTCGLTACTRGSAPGPTLVNEYGKISPLPLLLPMLPFRLTAFHLGTPRVFLRHLSLFGICLGLVERGNFLRAVCILAVTQP